MHGKGRVMVLVRNAVSFAWRMRRESFSANAPPVLNLSSSYTDMLLHSVALRTASSGESTIAADSSQITALFSALEAGKCFLDTILSFPVHEYHFISFVEWMRLPTVIITVARLCIPNDAHTSSGWDVKTAQDRVRLDLCIESLCYRMQQLSTFDKVKQPHPDFWFAMRFISDTTKVWYLRKISHAASSRHTPSGTSGYTGSERIGPSPGTQPTPAAETHCPMGIEYASSSEDRDTQGDIISFMQDTDFDMEQFFDMGIWGDETYTGMGFGGGTLF
jgi:hypothetical protein